MDTHSKVYIMKTGKEVELDSLTEDERNQMWEEFKKRAVKSSGYEIKEELAKVY